ncbi:MAG: ribosome biogenesis GTPase YlqF [Clostridia bacterium]|nr:ribosome biogenesis GTPase YlqF [Clostridia bacterium]
MFIHWFPGHMTKAIRMMSEEMKVVDSVIYVLDARAPQSCINPAFDEVIGNKPRLYVLNKADMVSQKEVIKWVDKFRRQGYKCIYSNSISKADAPVIVKNLLELNEDLIERYSRKGVNKTVRAMVIGVPNCGKSTLINSLTKEKKTVTGNRPGVTRGKQWVAIGEYIELLDSPGVLYPDFKDQEKAMRLALIGSVKEDVVDCAELALEALKYFMKEHPEELINRYKLDEVKENALEVMEDIGRKRGVIMRGGELDYERIAKIIIADFRKGYLGKFPLESADA